MCQYSNNFCRLENFCINLICLVLVLFSSLLPTNLYKSLSINMHEKVTFSEADKVLGKSKLRLRLQNITCIFFFQIV